MSIRIMDLLKKDLVFADFALNKLESEMKSYEKDYSLSWKKFIDKFEEGKLGDDRALFTWYALAASAKDWDDTKKEIKETIGTS